MKNHSPLFRIPATAAPHGILAAGPAVTGTPPIAAPWTKSTPRIRPGGPLTKRALPAGTRYAVTYTNAAYTEVENHENHHETLPRLWQPHREHRSPAGDLRKLPQKETGGKERRGTLSCGRRFLPAGCRHTPQRCAVQEHQPVCPGSRCHGISYGQYVARGMDRS